MADLVFQSRREKTHDGSMALVIKVLGPIDDSTSHQLEQQMIALLSRGIKNLTLVLSEVKNIHSAGVATLVRIKEQFQRNGGDIALEKVPGAIIDILAEMRLLSVFNLRRSTPSCPQCRNGEQTVPIVYGYPGQEVSEKAGRGEVMLGGCILGDSRWYCRECGYSWS